MITKEAIFNAIEDVKQSINRVEQYPQDADVCYGGCTVDGESILGILSLGIRRKLSVVTHDQGGAHRFVTRRPRSHILPPSRPILFTNWRLSFQPIKPQLSPL